MLNKLPSSAKFTLADIDPRHYNALQELIPIQFNLSPAACAKRKNEFYSGRWCAVQSLIKKNESDLSIQIGKDRAPIWPKGVVGSISHSDQLAAALVDNNANCLAIGLDIQPASSMALASDLKASILHPNEIKNFAQHYDEKLFDIIFSAKETLFKALYPSCSIFFDHLDAEVFEINATSQTLQIKLLCSLGHYWRQNQRFEINYDFVSDELITWLYIKT